MEKPDNELQALQRQTFDLRKNVVDMIISGGAGHIGGDMSVLDTLAVLYLHRMHLDPAHPEDPDRDRFVMSKGHSQEAYLAILAAAGFLDMREVLATYSKFGSRYIGHPNNKLPGIEMNTGALGHGLPVGVGMALAAKRSGRGYRTYVVMGDGELAEGSVWEAAMSASHYKLNNLCAVVDRNRLQISGSTEEVMAQDDLHARFSSFGWNVIDVANGNSVEQLDAAFTQAESCTERPTVLIANTVKGFGSGVMEDQAAWHHKVPNATEYEQIIRDFDARKEALQ